MSTIVRDVEQQPIAGQADEFIHHDHIGHGATPAAWTLSITIIIASVIAGIGFIIPEWTLVWIGAALVPVAIILGVVLKRMGYGVEMDSKAVLARGENPEPHRGPAVGGAGERGSASGTR